MNIKFCLSRCTLANQADIMEYPPGTLYPCTALQPFIGKSFSPCIQCYMTRRPDICTINHPSIECHFAISYSLIHIVCSITKINLNLIKLYKLFSGFLEPRT